MKGRFLLTHPTRGEWTGPGIHLVWERLSEPCVLCQPTQVVDTLVTLNGLARFLCVAHGGSMGQLLLAFPEYESVLKPFLRLP
jgi:hypothetical protein